MNIEHILSIVNVTCVELSSRYRAEIDAMHFGILGPLEARHQDSAVPVGGAKRRALLIALLANANRNVPVERLMLWMWPDEDTATLRAVGDSGARVGAAPSAGTGSATARGAARPTYDTGRISDGTEPRRT
jgi:hypothetical protein